MPNTARVRPFARARRTWRDDAGTRWQATLIRASGGTGVEREIQIDGPGTPPQRILSIGAEPPRLEALDTDTLELIRRAAHARKGFLWTDPRDGSVWWVRGRGGVPSRPTYSGVRWSGVARSDPPLPLTLLPDEEHQRLLDEVRQERRGRPPGTSERLSDA